MNKELFIGVDGGATHTKIRVWKNGQVVFETIDWPGVNMDLLGDGVTIEKLKIRISEIKNYQNYIWVIALAGIDNQKEKAEAENWWRRFLTSCGFNFSGIYVMSDIDLVLWAGSPKKVGVGLIAGTGSNGLACDENGKTYKVGGMSHLMSDEGSGFALGWEGLRLITKMSDGRCPKTKLLKDILDLYAADTTVDLKNTLLRSQNLKADIAKITPVLLEAMASGDIYAEKVVDEQIDELVLMAVTLLTKLSPTKDYEIYLAGSLFKNKDYLSKFENKVRTKNTNQVVTVVNPIDGIVNFVNKI